MEALQPSKIQDRFQPPDSDVRWLLAKRVAASSAFARSDRLSNLLLYVCGMHLVGRDEDINEQRIGIEVFGRKPSFDSGADSIVRSHATRLRRRLELYFQNEGRGETLRIEIPPGAYIPRFLPTEEEYRKSEQLERNGPPRLLRKGSSFEPEDLKNSGSDQHVAERSAWKTRSRFRALTAGIAVALIASVAFVYLHRDHRTLPPTSAVGDQTEIERQFWSGLLGDNQPALVVTGDSGLVLYETYSKSEVSLSDYLAGTYRARDPKSRSNNQIAGEDLADRRYTSVADLNLAVRLSHLPQWNDQHDQVVFARDLRPSEATKSNLILLGSRAANPWDSLIDGSLNFVLTSDGNGHFFFLNRHPAPEEKSIYAPSQPGSARSDSSIYALISYRPNIPGMSKVLLLSGLWLSGTEAAGQFVLSHGEFSHFLTTIAKPDGTIPPFELLVQIRSVAGNALNYAIIAKRVG